MSMEGPRLISATDIRRQDLIQCDPGDYEIRVADVQFKDSAKMVVILGTSVVGGEHRELSQAADVRLVEASPLRTVEPTTVVRKQRTPRNPRLYWSLAGFADEGDKWFEGPTINLQSQEQAYAALMEWILEHDLDDDTVIGVEPTWNAEDDDENLVLWAICVFTQGCALVAYRHRAGFQ